MLVLNSTIQDLPWQYEITLGDKIVHNKKQNMLNKRFFKMFRYFNPLNVVLFFKLIPWLNSVFHKYDKQNRQKNIVY